MSGKKILITALCTACFSLCTGEASLPQDTYINALQNSHHTDGSDNNAEGYDYTPSNNYLPAPTITSAYGPPASSYGGPPAPVFDSASSSYGPYTAPVYGPPSPIYGPPLYKPIYHPRDHWFLEKIKTKINLFTIGKIILKLLIFKKIVKFIGIICLLLFLPKLKDMFKEHIASDEEGTESKQVETEQDLLENRIEEIYDFVTKALKSYDKKY